MQCWIVLNVLGYPSHNMGKLSYTITLSISLILSYLLICALCISCYCGIKSLFSSFNAQVVRVRINKVINNTMWGISFTDVAQIANAYSSPISAGL